MACCRFVDAQRLAVLLRPRDEEEFGEERAFSTYVGVVLDEIRPARELGLRNGDGDPCLAGLEPIDPTSLGFRAPETHPLAMRSSTSAAAVLSIRPQGHPS